MSGYCTLGIDKLLYGEPTHIEGIYNKAKMLYDSGKPLLDTTTLVIEKEEVRITLHSMVESPGGLFIKSSVFGYDVGVGIESSDVVGVMRL